MRRFEAELNDLKTRLMDMSGFVQEMIKTAIGGLVNRDSKLFNAVFSLEKEVNVQEIIVDDKCLKLIALNQPVGVDLRFITSAMKINSDLERMGDEAVNISAWAVNLLKYPELKPLIDIPKMSDVVQQMLTDSIRAFNTTDAELAKTVLVKDDEADDLQKKITSELKDFMVKSSDFETIQIAVDLMFIARSLERIGDHATNISEDVIFMVHGKDVRHPRTHVFMESQGNRS